MKTSVVEFIFPNGTIQTVVQDGLPDIESAVQELGIDWNDGMTEQPVIQTREFDGRVNAG